MSTTADSIGNNMKDDGTSFVTWFMSLFFGETCYMPHEYIPSPVLRDFVTKYLLLGTVENADTYLMMTILFLIIMAIVQSKAFARPPPVPLKRLQKRPMITIAFKPDDIGSISTQKLHVNQTASTAGTSRNTSSAGGGNGMGTTSSTSSFHRPTLSTISSSSPSLGTRSIRDLTRTYFGRNNKEEQKRQPSQQSRNELYSDDDDDDDDDDEDNIDGNDRSTNGFHDHGNPAEENELNKTYGNDDRDNDSSDDDDLDSNPHYRETALPKGSFHTTNRDDGRKESKPTSSFIHTSTDLPDSFAPLLSSSQMDIITDQLSADLLHALSASASIKLKSGIHEIPLDKDSSRPQLRFHVPVTTGCKITAAFAVGSDGLTSEQDFNCTTTKNYTQGDATNQQQKSPKGSKPQKHQKQKTQQHDDKHTSDGTTKQYQSIRSKPMVKHGGLVFDPPLPLSNVAPTLIHFPTLFEDLQVLPVLRRLQFIRFWIELIISGANFIEKCLWILESKCQIHLSQIRITPLYKGCKKSPTTTSGTGKQMKRDKNDKLNATTNTSDTVLPEWRLSLSFSGHVLLFGVIPIPFIHVVLPTIIIPQPHALLEYLLSAQPLASARLRRENIAEQRITLALINMAESWKADLKVVATPPALGIDLTLPGGLAVAMEVGPWRDHQQGGVGNATSQTPIIVGGPPSVRLTQQEQQQQLANDKKKQNKLRRKFQGSRSQGISTMSAGDGGLETENIEDNASDLSAMDSQSLSSWTTNDNRTEELGETKPSILNRKGMLMSSSTIPVRGPQAFDANEMIPWTLEFSAKGSIRHEKMSFHILKLELKHSDFISNPMIPIESKFETRGSMAVWKHRSNDASKGEDGDSFSVAKGAGNPIPFRKTASTPNRLRSSGSHPELETEDSPSVAAILLFPDETSSYHNDLRLLQYDYVFDVFEDSRLDAITISVGATHPMLNGGTMITTILDTIYAYGSFTARENAVLDPNERRRKRNILRHLPATDFTFGIQNIFIPPESNSYSDDGQTLFIPEIEGGRMMVHFLGGIDSSDNTSVGSSVTLREAVSEGVKVVADFEFVSSMRSEGNVKEFPELDIFPGVKLRSLFSGLIVGSVKAHLRPQVSVKTSALSTTGPNVFNPLEAYEIDFSRSSLSVKVKEYSTTLGHRRVMFPAESTFLIQVTESIVDMGFEGKTQCDLSWDFQGLSPILQVTSPGGSPETALPENKEQVTLLVGPLRQGRFSLNVSSVGGISITKAATSRDDKEGLYDWKFFNALVSPDGESAGRIIDVLHDKRTMGRFLQVVKLVNSDLHKLLDYVLQQVWRAKDILDKEGVSDPRHAIPMYKMARLISLFLAGNVDYIDSVLPIVQRVVDGDGIDVVQVKVLLRDHLEPQQYDDWAAEIDRAVRFLAVALGPVSAAQPYMEDDVIPLAEIACHAEKLRDIPSANQLYEVLVDKPQLPLAPAFSNLVSRVSPYLTFKQIEYILHVRVPADWQPADLRRIRYVYSIKRKVLEIAESYGGLSFLPQSFFLSVFLGEATRSSLRASKTRQNVLPNGYTSRKKAVQPLHSRNLGRRHSSKTTTLSRLRRRPNHEQVLRNVAEEALDEDRWEDSVRNPPSVQASVPDSLFLDLGVQLNDAGSKRYELGDSLLGPQDVSILLQAGLTSVMKSSTVVQLNQRMLLDLICSQPRSFAIAVLADLGTPSGHGSSRSLTSALMALLELDQTAFKATHQIDMHSLLESWLPGIKVPRRNDYMAGGRFARQSYYGAVFSVSKSILDDAESYLALKFHLQRVRKHGEKDPIPQPRDIMNEMDSSRHFVEKIQSKHHVAVEHARSLIAKADAAGASIMSSLIADKYSRKRELEYEAATALYNDAFAACATVLVQDKHSFFAPWFKDFYQRNFDALQVKSVYDNVIDDVDNVRYWLDRLWKVAKKSYEKTESTDEWKQISERVKNIPTDLFEKPDKTRSQMIVDAIIEAIFYERVERERIRNDPLTRLLISNHPGHYDFVIISAAGVVTEGKNGTELQDAFDRLEAARGVKVIRADTATARSLEYNASRIEEAIQVAARKMKKPYGLLGYSQGCANALMAESMLFSGSPKQQQALSMNGGLVCRQLLFSAANGSFHGPAMDKKIQNLITMSEDFFKSQAGYFSRAFSASVLESLNSILDSAHFHKLMGGAQSFLEDGCRAFWREAQHLSHVPTCTMRGVMEEHTTPESLEMISHMLTKQSGSHLHDSQVHVFDAVGHPVYHRNRNARLLKHCDIGCGAIQRTHHWSPLQKEVEFVTTPKDLEIASFDCAKDRHVFPWVDVNARFGFIKYVSESGFAKEKHASKLAAVALPNVEPIQSEEKWETF